MAEIYGKATGCLGGRGGSMHLGDPSIGILPSIAIVGASSNPRAISSHPLAYMRRVVAGLKREARGARVPSIVFTKGGGLWLPEMADLDCDVLGVDWTVVLRADAAEPGKARRDRRGIGPQRGGGSGHAQRVRGVVAAREPRHDLQPTTGQPLDGERPIGPEFHLHWAESGVIAG